MGALFRSMPPRGDRRVIREGEAHQRVHRQKQEHDNEEGDRAQPTDSQDRRPRVLENGIVSSLSPTDLDNIRSVFGAVVKGDGYRVGELFLDRSKHFCTDRESFIKAMDSVM